jgi:hypothetical protein
MGTYSGVVEYPFVRFYRVNAIWHKARRWHNGRCYTECNASYEDHKVEGMSVAPREDQGERVCRRCFPRSKDK